jgi:nuclear pore complex protein Nup188
LSSESKELLLNARAGFPGPSASAKSTFESKTAAINITPSSSGHYNLGEIKEDALWLSGAAKIDQVVALRIVVHEWQQRPKFKLQRCYSEAELASIRDAAGTDSYNVVSWNGSEAFSGQGEDAAIRFDTAESRASRLLLLYLDERKGLLATSKYLHERALSKRLSSTDDAPGKGKNGSQAATRTLEELGESIIDKEGNGASRAHSEQYVISCVETMQLRLTGLESGSGWFKAEGGRDEVESGWTMTNLQELGLIMDTLILHLCAFRRILGSEPLLSWLRLVARFRFLAGLEPQTEEQVPLITSLRSSISFVTLALFDVLTSVSCIATSGDLEPVDQQQVDQSFYFFDHGSVTEIHEIMLGAASTCNIPASPAVFAWGMILYTIRELALSAREAREGHHVQKTIDHIVVSELGTGRRHSGSSSGSTYQSLYEDVMDAVRVASIGEDPVEYLMRSALDGSHVFDVVIMLTKSTYSEKSLESYYKGMLLQDLVSAAVGPLGYSPEVLTAELAILATPEPSLTSTSPGNDFHNLDLRTNFWNNDSLMESIFDVALSRFPYEMLPCLELCKAITTTPNVEVDGLPASIQRLRSMKTFTKAVAVDFSAYHTIREDENANLVSLECPLEMLGSSAGSSLGLLELGRSTGKSDERYHIPASTIGQVISETRPTVIMWYHQYSGLSYLGKWLEQYVLGYDLACISLDSPQIVASEIISLLRMMIRTIFGAKETSFTEAERADTANRILEETSDGLDNNIDVTSIIFDIFEQELQGLRYRRTSDRSLDLAQACVEFVTTLINVNSSRVWPALARSSLLGTRGRDGVLSVVVSSVEAFTGNFDFLERAVSLYDALVENAIHESVPKAPPNLNHSRTTLATNNMDAPIHFVSQVLLSFTQTLIDMHDNIQSWKFHSAAQKKRLNSSIACTFSKTIKYVYGADDSNDLFQKWTKNISSSALCIVDNFCTVSGEGVSSTTLLRILITGLSEQDPFIQPCFASASIRQTNSVLDLCFILLRVGALLGRANLSMLSQLLNAFPVLVRLCISEDSVQVPTLDLMNELLRDVNTVESGPLLGRLGSESSGQFLDILANFAKPTSSNTIFEATWRLLTSLVGSRQQWFAVLLLTGSSPRSRLRQANQGAEATSESAMRGKPFLAAAIDLLSQIDNVPPPQAISLLEFVNRAQENWAWTTNQLHSQPEFFSAIADYVGNLESAESGTLRQCWDNKIASLIADLATVYLHYAKAMRDTSVIKKMIPLINWLSNNATDVSGYNSSLHGNLRKNFAARYQCSLSNFKRTTLVPTTYGDEYFYDVELATKLLGFDPSWMGRGRTHNQGFLSEVRRANLNMSLVDSQVMLLYSFKTLSIEHSAFFVQDREVQKLMARVVTKCLQGNTRIYPAENIFETLFQTRADFTLALMQRLVDIKAKGSSFVSLLATAWETVRFRDATYDSAIANDGVRYYRSLLTILLLAMQFHIEKRSKPRATAFITTSTTNTSDPAASVVLEIAKIVVAPGVVSVTSFIHDQGQNSTVRSEDLNDRSAVGPRDLFILLSLLETILRLSLVPQIISQVSDVCTSSGMIESCLLLLSWSHVLPRSIAPDKAASSLIHADLSLRLLVSLSLLPLVAEELAVEGALARISAARIIHVIQSSPGGILPLDSRGTQYQGLYSVWSTGILPLCLNLLHSMGRPMASEISAFLNQFPHQLTKASTAFSYSSFSQNSDGSKGVISLASANEATTMALISHILAKYRAAGASAGVDSLDIPNLEGYDEHRKVLAEEIEDLLGRSAMLKARIVATDAKEQVWLKDGTLERKITEELRFASMCLRGTEGEE